jgi:serine/threonine-protein kinase
MAERETLLSTVPVEIRGEAGQVYDQGVDPHQVVSELHRRGLLRDEQLRDAVLALEASLQISRVRRTPPHAETPRILGPLGAGAMGEVLIGKDDGLNRVVAIKRLHRDLAARPSVLQRFYKEAQITAQLDHPNIVPIHSLVGDDQGGLSYTMKLVRGRTFESYFEEARTQLQTHGREGPDHTLSARLERFLHVCDALAYAHERGVLHRDLKPENIMVGTFGQVMVMDWGIAKLLSGPDEPAVDSDGAVAHKVQHTRVGAVLGTPRYMSPEQAEGKNDTIDARADQYSLGLVLQELVTLSPAVSPELDLQTCLSWAKSAKRQAMSPYRGAPRIPRELVAIVAKACARRPEDRYPSVGALAEDIRRFLRDESVLARPDSLLQRVQRWIGRHRSLVLLLLVSLALLLVVGASTLALGGVGVLEWRRRVAASREEAITRLLTVASTQAGALDARVRDMEALVTGLSFAAEGALERPRTDDVSLGYDPVSDPPVLRDSTVYGRPVALDRLSIGLVPGVEPAEVREQLDRLGSTTLLLARVFVDSADRPGGERITKARRQELLANEGVPAVWAHLGLQDGISATFPATGPVKRGVADPRNSAWYLSAREPDGGVSWSGPSLDPDGMGAVITGALPLFDHQARLLGVAAVDLTLDALASELGPPPGFDGAWLVDGEGRAVAWPGMRARGLDSYAPSPLVDPALRQALRDHPSGLREARGQVAVWSRVPALGWTWLGTGTDDLLR